MKTRIAALLMSLAMSINGGPIEVEETEPAIIPEEVITETVLTQQIIPEDIVEETVVTEELEGEPLKAELSAMSDRLYKAFNATRVTVADKASVVFGDAEQVMAKIGDKLIFWN